MGMLEESSEDEETDPPPPRNFNIPTITTQSNQPTKVEIENEKNVGLSKKPSSRIGGGTETEPIKDNKLGLSPKQDIKTEQMGIKIEQNEIEIKSKNLFMDLSRKNLETKADLQQSTINTQKQQQQTVIGNNQIDAFLFNPNEMDIKVSSFVILKIPACSFFHFFVSIWL